MTIPIAELVPMVAPEVSGCPQVLIRAKLLLSVIEFCQRAKAWRQEIQIPVTALTDSYKITTKGGAAVANILSVRFGSDPLDPATDALTGEPGPPVSYVRRSSSTIKLCPPPDSDGTLYVLASVKPSAFATDMEDFIANDHFDTIAAGAKARLMAMPKQKWTNPSLANYYQDQFDNGVVAASVEAQKGNVGASTEVSPSKW